MRNSVAPDTTADLIANILTLNYRTAGLGWRSKGAIYQLGDDGGIELEVDNVKNGVINCRIIHGGLLGNSKSVKLPETQLAMSAVSPENRDNIVKELSFAAENDVDYIAASFVQSADDIYKMREILVEKEALIPIIAKIENKAGVANMEEIVDVADSIMVARDVRGGN